MTRRPRPPKPTSVQVLVGGAAFLLLFALYIAVMRIALDTSKLQGGDLGDHRDEVYFAIHIGLATFAGLVGLILGKWLNGLGFAFFALFAVTMLTIMLVATLGSYNLACSGGHNDILRHWTCSRR